MKIPCLHVAFMGIMAFAQPLFAGSAFPAEGIRLGLIGDSITHDGNYPIYLDAFYYTRFPHTSVETINLGISGDSAGGVLGRFRWDIAPRDMNGAVVMLGMNDVGRHLYSPGEPSPETLAKRQQQIENYNKYISRIVELLKEKGVEVTLVTPSSFDDTSTQNSPNLPGVNLALAECSARVKKIAEENSLAVIDIHTSMTRLNTELQADDPAFTIVGKDRVHPGSPGHLAMMYWFLKAQEVSGEIAHVSLDVADARATGKRNCTLSDLSVSHDRVQFDYLAGALPFPVPPEATRALNWVPLVKDLNQETLQISGLDEGDYQLEIDGERVRAYSSAELAAGVNLALEPSTPQARQARRVLELCVQKGRIIRRLRTIIKVEFDAAPKLPRPVTLEEVRPLLENRLKAAVGKPWESYVERTGAAYLKDKILEDELQRQVADLTTEARKAAIPEQHRVVITRLAK
jgi:lysophospholipase L1-like esterase